MDNEVSYDKERLSSFAELANVFYNAVVNKKAEIETCMTNIANNWNGDLGNLVKKDIDNITAKLDLIEKNALSISNMLSSVANNFNKITY